VGLCAGFLPHNFYPARIFMGDAGAMLLGVLVAASTLAVVGQDSYQFSGRTYFFFAPIIIPFFILGIPLLDTLFAVVRRAGKRMSPAVADLNHLHHRLMRLGHGHRQAVIILWAWTALLSGLVLWPGVTNSHNEIPPIAVGGLAILLYTLFAPRGRAGVGASENARGVANGENGHGAGTRGGEGAAGEGGTGEGDFADQVPAPPVVLSRPAPAGAGARLAVPPSFPAGRHTTGASRPAHPAPPVVRPVPPLKGRPGTPATPGPVATGGHAPDLRSVPPTPNPSPRPGRRPHRPPRTG
jgi:hypothetical protein